ncbi:hypothetical protein HYX14_01275 [Candidatus Woesearchaeota archaeon]|nr:hypothetical protein [Candidatus Woesearchaeota archaeon]
MNNKLTKVRTEGKSLSSGQRSSTSGRRPLIIGFITFGLVLLLVLFLFVGKGKFVGKAIEITAPTPILTEGGVGFDILTATIAPTDTQIILTLKANLGSQASGNIDVYVVYDPTLTVSEGAVVDVFGKNWDSGKQLWKTEISPGQLHYTRKYFISGEPITGNVDVAKITFTRADTTTKQFKVYVKDNSVIYNAGSNNIITNIVTSVNNPTTITVVEKAPAAPAEICTDVQDNDGDGKIDCADSDCKGSFGPNDETCGPETDDYSCRDLGDNDGDGLTDCKDPDCNTKLGQLGPLNSKGISSVCLAIESSYCADSYDNDADGSMDCADSDCAAACTEVCDGKDNNANGQVDDGALCSAGENCVSGACAKGWAKDCNDQDAKIHVAAPDGPCDGKDNNCDGQIDENPLCSTGYNCVGGKCTPAPKTCIETDDSGKDYYTKGIVDITTDTYPANGDQCKAENTGYYSKSGDPGPYLLEYSCSTEYASQYSWEIKKCADLGAGLECQKGACVLKTCPTGLADCDKVASNGCEIDINSNVNYCGGCTKLPCSTSQECVQGVCKLKIQPEICTDSYDNDGDGLADCKDSDCTTKTGPPNPSGVSGSCQLKETSCADLYDNNADGLADCKDTDCVGKAGPAGATCQPPQETECANKIDDNKDGKIDCADEDCQGKLGPAGKKCEATETLCADGADNDGDTLTDCVDANCKVQAVCGGKESACADKIDNDKDQQIDCADADCSYYHVCGGTETLCNDVIDNDNDGKKDCFDSDCVSSPACLKEDCTDAKDNDADGLIDCFDNVDCAGKPGPQGKYTCENTETTCADSYDNDGDGNADCADSDCNNKPGKPGSSSVLCNYPKELVCNDEFDNDAGEGVDCADTLDCASAVNCKVVTVQGDSDGNSCLSSAEYTLFKAKYKKNNDNIQNTMSSSDYTVYKGE